MKMKNLKKLLVAGMILFSGLSFAQKPLHFGIRQNGLLVRGEVGYLKTNKGALETSVFNENYKVEFKKLNDTTYQEIIHNNFFLKEKTEILTYYYSSKDSCWYLDDYSVSRGKPRKTKQNLEGNVFNKKYRTLIDLVKDFQENNLEDSVHFIALGLPYSIKVDKEKIGDYLKFSCDPTGLVKTEPGDFIIFCYPVEAYAKKMNGEVFPFLFKTAYKNILLFGAKVDLEGYIRAGTNSSPSRK